MISRQQALGIIAGTAAAAAVPDVVRAAAPQSLSVGQIGNSVAFFPNFVAQNQGFFKEAGLDVTITPFASGTLVGTAVTSNSVDIGTSVITDVFSLLKANRPVKLVGSLCDAYYIDITASNQFLDAVKLTRASPLDKKIQSLKGKNIGINGPGSGTQALVEYLLRGQGLDPQRDVTLVNIGADQGSVLTTLKTGRIDVVSFAWPLSMLAQTNNIGKPFIMPAEGDVPSMREQIQGVIYVKPDLLAKRQDAVIAFVHAIARAEALLHRNTTLARTLLKQYDNALSDPAIDLLLQAYLPALPQEADIAANSYEKALQFHRLTGFAGPTGNSYAEVVDTTTLLKAIRNTK
jgi:ABC-type nitrate/sulfonate/bicarbonate transport system substrate-binding protein